MTFAARANRNVVTGGPVSGSATLDAVSFYATVAGTVTLNTNGTMTATDNGLTQSLSTCSPNWYSPTTVGIGSSYWVKFTLDTGNAWDSGLVNNTVYALSSARALTWTTTSIPGTKAATATARIYSDAGGTTLVATVAITVDLQSATI